ncbi:hypothetical protein P171DRAFT_162112 [Karstenula rhodostoma CBS 690.94]|uniref:Uncharacterized protein n=1 Tax=Karstenula rhodostoma CBS 690.94 TaxID=1392251 RepID=A0A9P4P864_9PLEO|nr:hypothetical protein P171DRAFT_162112 [Karstenula rhodostoma CBS 690.94]
MHDSGSAKHDHDRHLLSLLSRSHVHIHSGLARRRDISFSFCHLSVSIYGIACAQSHANDCDHAPKSASASAFHLDGLPLGGTFDCHSRPHGRLAVFFLFVGLAWAGLGGCSVPLRLSESSGLDANVHLHARIT